MMTSLFQDKGTTHLEKMFVFFSICGASPGKLNMNRQKKIKCAEGLLTEVDNNPFTSRPFC